MELTENMQKYENYRDMKVRLKRALKGGFYLEAVFIEYGIIEDRLDSVLRYEGNSINSKNHVSIDRKIKKVKKLTEEKKGLARKYFAEDFLDSIHSWKERRNPLIHELMKQPFLTDEMSAIAAEGEVIVKELCRCANNYKRAVERKSKN